MEIDINELKLTEQALRESEERFSKAFQANPAPMAITEIESGLFLDANDKWLNLFGYTREELIGRTSLELNMHVDPALRQAMITQLRQEGSFKEVDMLIQTKAGQYVNALWSAEMINLGGRAVMLTLLIDVTERKKAELRILESMGLLQATLESAADGILVTDLNACVINYNRRFVELSQIPETILASGDDRTVLKRVLAQLKEPGTFLKGVRDLYAHPNVEQHDVLRFLDGRFFESYSIPTYRGDEIIGRVWSFRDVTDTKHAEDALRESEERFSKAFRANPAPMVITDLETGRFLDANERWLSLIGYTREDMIGFTSRDLNIYADQGTRERMVAELRREGLFKEVDLRLRTKSGQIVDVLWSAEIINLTGQKAMLSLLIDVTERKQAEEVLQNSKNALSTLLDNTYDAIFLHDLEGHVTDANRRMLDLYQVTREQIPFLTIYDYSSPDNPLENLTTIWKNVLKGEKNRFDWIARRPNDGSLFPVEVFLTKIKLGLDEKILANVRDITERKQSEKQILESLGLLQATLESTANGILVTDLAGKVIHYNRLFVEMWRITEEILASGEGQPILQFVIDQLTDPDAFISGVQHLFNHPQEERRDLILFKDGRIFDRYSIPTYRGNEIVGRVWSFNDITLEKQAENALRESEVKYRRLHESMTDAFIRVDLAGRIVETNKSFRNMIGYTDEELFQLTYEELTPVKWHAAEEEITRNQALVRGYSDIYEKEYIRKDGTVFPIEIRAFLIRDDEGQPIGRWAIVRDITERKRAEEALRESEERYRSIVENIAEGIFQTSLEGKFLSVNPALVRMFGYSSPEEMIENIKDIGHQIYANPADRQQIMEALRQDGHASGFECENIRRDGTRFWVAISAHFVRDAQREVLYIEGTTMDITERKQAENALRQSEAKYRRLHQSMTDAFARTDMQGRLLEANKAFQDMLGYTHEELSQMSYKDITPAAWHTAEADIIESQVLSRGYSDIYEKEYIRKNGDLFPVEVRTYLIRDDSKKPGGFWAIVRDITERKQVENALRESEALFRSQFEYGNIGIAITSVEKGWLRVNHYICDLLGYSEEELRSKTWAEMTHPEDLQADVDQFNRLLSGEIDAYEMDKRYVRKDGEIIVAHLSVSCFRNADRSIRFIISSLLDITETTKALEKLRTSEATLRALMNATADALFVMDKKGNLLALNDTLARRFGQSVDEMLGTSINDYMPAKLARQRLAYLAQAVVSGDPVHFVDERQEMWFENTFYPIFDTAGAVVMIAAYSRDVTETKKAEEALRLTQFSVDRASDSILWLDENANLIYANDAVCTALGYTREELLSMSIHDLDPDFPPEAWPPHVEELRRRKAITFESGHRTKDGRIFPVEVTCNYFEYNGHFYSFSFDRDISQRKQTELELKQYRDHLEEQVRERTQALSEANDALIRFRRFAEASGQGFGMATLDGTIIYANATLRDLINDGNLISSESLSFIERYPVAYRNKLQNEIIPQILEDKQWIGELALVTVSGEIIPTIENYFLIRDEAGNPALIADVVTDIRDMKRTENELKKYQDHLEDLVKKRTLELQKLNKDLQKEIIIRTDAEKALRASEQRYRTLFDNAPIGISIMKPDLTFDYFNPRFTEMTGYSLDDLPDKNAWFEKAYPNPDYRQKVTEMWQKDLKSEAGTERKGDRILKVRTQKGQDIIIHFRTAVLENGEHLMSYEDVTELQDLNDALRAEIAERILAEEALRESEERYRTLFNGAPVGISVTTADGTIVAANEGLANLLKASSIVETFDTNARSVYLDPLEREKLLERLSRDGYVRDYETRLQCLDGMIRDVLITLSRISYQGKDAIMAVLQDISWKKQAEEETRHLKNYLANIIDSMPSMLVGVDTEGQVTQWNTAAQETTGIDANLARGQHLEQVLPLLSHHIDLIREAIYANRAQIFPRLQNVIKGENRFMDVTVYPLVSNGVSGAVVRVDDVTDRIRMEEMMIQSEKMLSVGGLAAGMAHEINNPLGVIMAATQNVVRRIVPDLPANIKTAETCGLSLSAVHDYMEKRQILTFLEDIRNGVVRANQIVTNMLSFSRRPSEGGALESMADLLDQTLLLAASDYDLKKKYDFRQILIERDYHPETPKVFCQASKIQQVFLNILRNGAEAMEENRGSKHPPCFKLRLYPDQDRVRIEIRDNGPGMDEATRRRIFEPFFTTKPPGVGTGLGLSVSYFIITQNHDGAISVESAPGEGTCFIIELPVKEYPV